MNTSRTRKIKRYFRMKAMGREKFVYKHGVYRFGVGLWIATILIYLGSCLLMFNKIDVGILVLPIIFLPMYIILGIIYGGYKWKKIKEKIEL